MRTDCKKKSFAVQNCWGLTGIAQNKLLPNTLLMLFAKKLEENVFSVKSENCNTRAGQETVFQFYEHFL